MLYVFNLRILKMGICCVYDCHTNSRNSKEKGLHFFKFPKNKKLAKQWLHSCRRKDKINVKNARMCSAHFTDDDFNNLIEHQMMGTKLYLKPNAVPSINLPSTKCIDEGTLARNIARSQRAAKRQKINEPVQTRLIHTETNAEDSTHVAVKRQKKNESVQTSLERTKIDTNSGTQGAAKIQKIIEPVQIRLVHTETIAKDITQGAAKGQKIIEPVQIRLVHTETIAKDSTQGAANRKKINESVQTSLERTKIDAKDNTTFENNKVPQTTCSEPISSRQQILENENLHLRKVNERLRQQLQSYKKIFTKGQVSRILQPYRLTHWEQKDITAAIELKNMSLKCYNYLRDVRKFPLPSVGTLKHWIKDLGADNCSSLSESLKANTSVKNMVTKSVPVDVVNGNSNTNNEIEVADKDSNILKTLLTKKKL